VNVALADRGHVPAQLSKEEQGAYRALMRVVLAGPRAVSADIAPEFGLGLSDHLVLQRLSEAPGHRMRMTELAIECGVSVSGITRIMNRLEDEGLTTRVRSSRDARSAYAMLTEVGQARLEQAQQAHLASVRRHIFDHLGDIDLACLTSRMDRIADSMVMAPEGRSAPTGAEPVGRTSTSR
jgi:DNA-binding MarR family transcriptional regulator